MAAWVIALGALRRAFIGHSEAGEAGTGGSLKGASAAFLVVLAPTLSVAAWDWAMSLEPEWFSTMYGVYLFSGAVLGGIATVSVVLTAPGAEQRFGHLVDRDVLHDLGRLLFGFSSFWAYIWFCQYMLIWYANIPEEATYFALRLDARWTILFWIAPILSFVVPFFVLLPVRTKRSRSAMFQVSLVVLVGLWLDTYLMVWPPLETSAAIPWVAIAVTAAMIGAMVFVWQRAWSATRSVGSAASRTAPEAPAWSPDAGSR
jgi:hypothetical protein